MTISRRTMLGAAAALAAGTAAPGIIRAQGNKPELTSLSLGFGIDPPFAAHILGITKGWFKEAGFQEVQQRTFSAGALAGEALLAGDIQIWTPGNLPPIAMASNGTPVVVLGNVCTAWNLEKLVVREDANVNVPEDLYNVKIGVLVGSTASAMLHGIVQLYGLDEKRVQVVNLPPPEQFTALTSNNVQAILCWEPWPYRAMAAGRMKVLHTGLTSQFAGNKGKAAKVSSTRTLFVASQEFVRKYPQTAAAAIQVLVRGVKQCADSSKTDETIAIFSKFQKQDPELVKAIWGDYTFTPVIDQTYLDDMEFMKKFLESTGRLRDKIEILDFTYTKLLSQIDPELVKVEGRWRP